MILRRLSLKNYRKYRSLEIEFPTGLIGVVGRNGMGKTTLLEAVAFTLYGAEASRTKSKGIRLESAHSEEPCEVDMEFSLGGEPYRVLRRLRGMNESQQAELYHGGSKTPIASQPTGVTAAIRKMLSMDYSTFTRSVYSKQKEVNALSDARPEERRKAIRRMVGVETVTEARDAAKAERRDKELEVKGARTAIEELPNKKAEAEKIRKELKPALSTANSAKRNAVTAAKVVESAKAKWGRLEEKRTTHGKLNNQESGLSSSLRSAKNREKQLEDDLASLKEKKAELGKILPEERKFRLVREEKERLDRASGKYDERIQLEDGIQDSQREVEETHRNLDSAHKGAQQFHGVSQAERAARDNERKLRAELRDLEKKRRRAEHELGKAQSEKGKVEKALYDVRRHGPTGQCPTCYRQFGESFQEIAAHLKEERKRCISNFDVTKKHQDAIAKNIRNVTRRVDAASRDVRAAMDEGKHAASAREKLEGARQAHARAKRALREKQTRLKALRQVKYDVKRHEEVEQRYNGLARTHDRAERLRQELGRASTLKKELREKTREVKNLRTQLAGVKRKLAALRFDPGAYASARQAYEDAQDNKTEAVEARTAAQGEVKRLQEALDRTQAEVSRLENLQKRIAEDEESIRYLKRIEALLDDFRLELINRVRPQIEEHASMLFDQVTDGRYPRIVLDEDYSIAIHDGAGAYPIRRFSGGEEDLANLCLRLAISQVVANRTGNDSSSLVVLDEIFGSQDAERRERILQALGKLQEIFQQIVLITHLEDIHDRVPTVLRITENSAHEAQALWL